MSTDRRHLENQDLRRLITAGQLMALELRRRNGEGGKARQQAEPVEGLPDVWDGALRTFHDNQVAMVPPITKHPRNRNFQRLPHRSQR